MGASLPNGKWRVRVEGMVGMAELSIEREAGNWSPTFAITDVLAEWHRLSAEIGEHGFTTNVTAWRDYLTVESDK